jgi:hypothetical protein
MKKIFLFLLPLAISNIAFAQQTFPVNGISNKNHIFYAFTNAKIFVDNEVIIEKGILLIKEGLIIDVGEKVNIPKGTVVVDLKGKSIYPALIDAYTNYGIPVLKRAFVAPILKWKAIPKGLTVGIRLLRPKWRRIKFLATTANLLKSSAKLVLVWYLLFRKMALFVVQQLLFHWERGVKMK